VLQNDYSNNLLLSTLKDSDQEMGMANLPEIGKLERVDLRNIWGDEARNFTPWLATDEAIGLLSEVIGQRGLVVIGREVAVGPYSADILAKVAGNEDHKVVIENQLGKTDHDHLGKMITYAAGLGAKTLVWISDRFCEEHRAALDWLNQNTVDGLNFFGLEIHAYRIDGSRPAPQFSIISRPNSTSKAIREEVSSSERKSREELLLVAAKRNVESLTATLLKLANPMECVWAEPSRTYGGSFRCWRKSPDGNWRLVLGINVSGQRKQTPVGQLDIWLPLASIAAVSETSVGEAQQALQSLPVYIKEVVDWIIRLKDESEAEAVVQVLWDYFEAHPGAAYTTEKSEVVPAQDV
jgi:hypothetical protein